MTVSKSKSWKSQKDRTIAYCHAERARLINSLGSCCLQCRATEKLEFHHTKPRGWIASQLSRWQRIAEYKRDIARGEIVLLCKSCNQRAGKPLQPGQSTEPDF